MWEISAPYLSSELNLVFIDHRISHFTWTECLRSAKRWCYVIIDLQKSSNRRINTRFQTGDFVSFPWSTKIKVGLIKDPKHSKKREIPHLNMFVNSLLSSNHLLTNSLFPSTLFFFPRPNLGHQNLFWKKYLINYQGGQKGNFV